MTTPSAATRTLRRPRRGNGRLIAGVCAGIARRFNTSPNLVRVLFILSCILPGPQVLMYLLLWAFIPSD